MSINLDEWKDYERSHNYVEAAKYHAGQGSLFGLSKRTPALVLLGVKNIIKVGAVVPEDVDYIKSIVGIDDSVSLSHMKGFAIDPRIYCNQFSPKVYKQ